MTEEPLSGGDHEGVPSAAVRSANIELPERQRRIVGLIARGYTTEQIADMLRIRPNTVSAHRRAALLRLGLHSAVGLTHWAIVRGLVQPGDVPGDEREG